MIERIAPAHDGSPLKALRNRDGVERISGDRFKIEPHCFCHCRPRIENPGAGDKGGGPKHDRAAKKLASRKDAFGNQIKIGGGALLVSPVVRGLSRNISHISSVHSTYAWRRIHCLGGASLVHYGDPDTKSMWPRYDACVTDL
jgi:hypothetical protein